MYEPIRTKAVDPRIGGRPSDYPRSSRAEALDIQLAGHLAALLAVTDELGLDEAATAVAAQVSRLRGSEPARAARRPGAEPDAGAAASLHQRAHDLAARALLVAASRADTTVAILAAERMDAHAAALDLVGAH
ncbi:SCO4983 family protein [Streptomyces sp. NPDC002104]